MKPAKAKKPAAKPAKRPAVMTGAAIPVLRWPPDEDRVEAIFERFNGEERVVLLMKLLHKSQQVCFPLRSVARIDCNSFNFSSMAVTCALAISRTSWLARLRSR